METTPMSAAQEIISRLAAGDSIQRIGVSYAWPALPLSDREELFDAAENDHAFSRPIIRLLSGFTMSPPTPSKWDGLRAAALCVRKLEWNAAQKRRAIQWMENTLAELAALSEAVNEETRRRMQTYTGELSILRALVCIENDQLREAQGHYDQAAKTFTSGGLLASAEAARKQSARIREVLEHRSHILPLDQYESERLRMEQVLADLQKRQMKAAEEQRQVAEALKGVQAARAELETQVSRLTRTKAALEEETQRAQRQITELQEKQANLNAEVQASQTALQFMLAMRQHTATPLWLEVVRLALKQGQLDELARQALARLLVPIPDGAEDILVETLARLPEGLAPAGLPTARGQHWMSKLRLARQKQKEDPAQAARLAVEAWEAFFQKTSL